jgi:hypothetical protein
MAWITLTAGAVKTRLTKPEMSAVLTAAKQTDQTAEDLLDAALASVTAEVRGYVSACDRNRLGEAGTIPDELETAATALIRRYLFTRLPGMQDLFDEIRQTEVKDALARLRDTAACKFAIVPPADPAPAAEQVQSGSPKINRRKLRFRRSDGIGL